MIGSIDVAREAIRLSLTENRKAEEYYIEKLKAKGYKGVAIDFGGNLINSIPKIIEKALVASRKTGIINESHVHDGAVAGAVRDAIMQITPKAVGLNAGGKIAVARYEEHLAVSIFLSMGLVHLNEIIIGFGHRSIPND